MKKRDENIENKSGNRKKDQPFNVPEGYFENFADRLMARIEEEEQPDKKRSLFFYLKPALMMAASFAFVMLLVYVPIKKFLPSTGIAEVSQQKVKTDSVDAASGLPATLISYFSESQFMLAVTDMTELEPYKLSNDDLGEYIADNYSDYDVIANN
ncbi:MAG TPA: hypothetical protein VFC67_27555 [Prolixibacteraceae bacterium]|nr:hypothetical protein [Prolixibacteraceae bacterium]